VCVNLYTIIFEIVLLVFILLGYSILLLHVICALLTNFQ